ncbi:MAG TPA: circadian clock protein KaiC [Candidatus Xenobia bacterium]|jgi:circadian clock protein KaiC
MNLIERVPTGIVGFDHISYGGLPKNRSTLVSGPAGSGKTVFAAQFLAEGIRRYDQAGVYVTFEESPDDIRRNMEGFGWPIREWETQHKWCFLDASPVADQTRTIIGSYDLQGLVVRIGHLIDRTQAARLAIDSVGSILSQFPDVQLIRQELFRIIAQLRSFGVTVLLTAERLNDYGETIARYGFEEFVTDNVVILRNLLDGERRRRTIEILKYRGTQHYKGECAFSILPEVGLQVIPLAALELKQRSSVIRISSGSTELDNMCGGGFFRDSIILTSGATGTGKTLLCTEFISGGTARGERCLLVAFEESREQLFRNASGWGRDYEAMEASGLLRVICAYPESAALEDHFMTITSAVEEYQPGRLAFDSLSALERISSVKGFREFVISFTAFLKEREICGLFTATTENLMGGPSITETHISTITDSILLLRYVEAFGQMTRALAVLKMRGSAHSKEIREFAIDSLGMHLGKALISVTGILSGQPRQSLLGELDHRVEATNPDSGGDT